MSLHLCRGRRPGVGAAYRLALDRFIGKVVDGLAAAPVDAVERMIRML